MATTSIYKRNTYIPTRFIKATKNEQVLTLDWYAAKYLRALDGIAPFTSFQVADSNEGRLDIISDKVYGTPDLWWVIALYNGIIHPLAEIETGTYLRIPSRPSVEYALQNKANDTSSTNYPTASAGSVTVELR